ncbi:hypothetical protein L484_000257 [Morus notabilis]|uniref:Uncharacterized protein n=1 Tax=Morus notabilis TaxID=981085 RepID=W9SD98_9ROSA|nr:hypothetical protein L484_000257 [Morus notabilis]
MEMVLQSIQLCQNPEIIRHRIVRNNSYHITEVMLHDTPILLPRSTIKNGGSIILAVRKRGMAKIQGIGREPTKKFSVAEI